jgi:3-methylcrotonyl-CoA carboxylase beta subunit
MAALKIINVLSVDYKPLPYSSSTGGTSQGTPGLGTDVDDSGLHFLGSPVAIRDKPEAAVLTVFPLAPIIGGGWCMIS